MNFHILVTNVVLVLLSVCSLDTREARSHNFDTDDNSAFLTLINQIIIETRLLNSSLNEPHLNLTHSVIHIDNIQDFLKEITISEDSLNIDSDQFYNNTVIATVVANLADEVLRKYGAATGVPSNIMLSMDFEKVLNHSAHISKPHIALNGSQITSDELVYERYSSSTHINLKNQQEAKAISDQMVAIYERELAGHTSGLNSQAPLLNLKISLDELKNAVGNITSPFKVMEIVHTKVHPSLQLSFNLTLKK